MTGLVLEGGALRGLFSAGIMDVMMENGIPIDGLIGVSAGAAFGCNYKSRQPGRCIRYNTRFARDWRYCSLRSLLTTGDLFGGEFCYHEMPKKLDIFDEKTFDANPMEYYVVCTDVETGRPVYRKLMHHSYECYEWIRASASMPVVSRIVKIGGSKLLDGGIADSIPLRYFQNAGYRRNIVIETQPRDYVKGPNRLLPLFRLVLHRYPEFLKTAAQRHLMYNQQKAYVRQQEALGDTLVLRPEEPLPIGHLSSNPNEMRRVYDIGYRMGLKRLDDIRRFVSASASADKAETAGPAARTD